MTHIDELLNPHEAELRDLLERTMQDATVPAEIGPHALIHGRRLRTRRRVGIAAGAVAASAAVALILPTALGGGSTSVIDPAGEPSSAASAPAQAPAGELPPGWWSMPSTDMVSAVEAILPDGITVTDPGPLEADTPEGGPGIGWINLTVTGPAGAGRLNVMLYPVSTTEQITLSPDPGSAEGGDHTVTSTEDGGCTAPEHVDSGLPCTELDEGEELGVGDGQEGGIDGDISCPGNLAPRAECTELLAANGTVIGRTSSTTYSQLSILEVVLRRDGGTVYGASINSLVDKPGRTSPTSAETPPLTLDQLEALVRNDTWVKPAT